MLVRRRQKLEDTLVAGPGVICVFWKVCVGGSQAIPMQWHLRLVDTVDHHP